jgi:hypothetical protein
MKTNKIIILFIFAILMLSGCGGGGGGGGTSPTPTPKITATINTQITGSNADSTISISGATSPIIYGFELTVNFPAGATFGSVSPIGVNSGNFVDSNLGTGNVIIGSVVNTGNPGVGSGDVLSVNFTNVPGTALATDFTVTGFIAKDSNGVTIQ